MSVILKPFDGQQLPAPSVQVWARERLPDGEYHFTYDLERDRTLFRRLSDQKVFSDVESPEPLKGQRP